MGLGSFEEPDDPARAVPWLPLLVLSDRLSPFLRSVYRPWLMIVQGMSGVLGFVACIAAMYAIYKSYLLTTTKWILNATCVTSIVFLILIYPVILMESGDIPIGGNLALCITGLQMVCFHLLSQFLTTMAIERTTTYLLRNIYCRFKTCKILLSIFIVNLACAGCCSFLEVKGVMHVSSAFLTIAVINVLSHMTLIVVNNNAQNEYDSEHKSLSLSYATGRPKAARIQMMKTEYRYQVYYSLSWGSVFATFAVLVLAAVPAIERAAMSMETRELYKAIYTCCFPMYIGIAMVALRAVVRSKRCHRITRSIKADKRSSERSAALIAEANLRWGIVQRSPPSPNLPGAALP